MFCPNLGDDQWIETAWLTVYVLYLISYGIIDLLYVVIHHF
jgi:hypothetical protein